MPDDPTGVHADYPITIGCQEVKQLQDVRASFLLLDCRNPDEFQAVHLEGATLVPMQELPQRIHEVEPFRDQFLRDVNMKNSPKQNTISMMDSIAIR